MSDKEIVRSIIDAIQRAELGDEDVEKYINKADDFLLGKKPKPLFYPAFKEKAKEDLKATINSCVKIRNDDRKKDDLKKYKEGYFNEIIQNANDAALNADANDAALNADGNENPEIEVIVSKEENNKYTVTCTYPDKGFSLLDLYGFCTRGNSYKTTENGQEGMYGIGIKSLFCFVDEFRIDSNISIHITSSKPKKLLDSVDIQDPQEERKKARTSLFFSFTFTDSAKDQHAGFNTKKLAHFIDDLYENKCLDKYLFQGKDEEILFDARSLFFTDLRKKDGKDGSKPRIKSVKIRKKGDEEAKAITIKSDEETVAVDEKNGNIVKIAEIKDKYKYVVFHYDSDQISLAFQYDYDQKQMPDDRIYATYFICSSETPLLGSKKTGCLVNTKAVNSSRSGLEREKEKDPEILAVIREKARDTITWLCALIKGEIDDEKKGICLDILCQLLYIYRTSCITDGEELAPNDIFYGKLGDIEDSIPDWKFPTDIKYILNLKPEDQVEKEQINKNKPFAAPADNPQKLYNVYKKYIFPDSGNVDVIEYSGEEYKKLTGGIRHLAEAFLKDSDEVQWISQLDLPFLKGVKELLEKRIGGSGFSQIHRYLYDNDKIDEDDRELVRQLIARYGVNDCFDYMGNYSEKSIGSWFFGEVPSEEKDDEYEKKCEEYENAYGELKNKVKDHIAEVSCYRYPANYPNADRAWKYEEGALPAGVALFDCYSKELEDKQIFQLAKLVCDGKLHLGKVYFGSPKAAARICDFVTNKKDKDDRNIELWYRNDFLKKPNEKIRLFGLYGFCKLVPCAGIKFPYIPEDRIQFPSICMESFEDFKMVRACIDEYNKKNPDFKFPDYFANGCKITQKISTVAYMFELLSTYEKVDDIYFDVSDLNFNELEEPETDSLIQFAKQLIKQLIEQEVVIKIDKISVNNKGKKFIGFLSNWGSKKGIYIRTSADQKFEQRGYFSDRGDKKYLLIYSSVQNEQEVLSAVLSELGYGDDVCYYIGHFIKTGNTTVLTAEEYTKYTKRRRLTYDYPFMRYDDDIEIDEKVGKMSHEEIYDFLSGEWSYDSHCPVCNSIPTLNINGENSDRIEKDNSLVVMFRAKYNKEDIYIKTICCKNCFEEYKASLTSAEIEDVPGKAYKEMILKSTISSQERSRDSVHTVSISPDNWRLIKDLNALS